MLNDLVVQIPSNMDAWKAKKILDGYPGKDAICKVFAERQAMPKQEIESLWEGYLEFMVIKAVGNDNSMRFSTMPIMDELWRCHVLCTQHYQEFMKLVGEVNPLMNFVHHSLLLSEDEKSERREATRDAYRKLFGKDCDWLKDGGKGEPRIVSEFSMAIPKSEQDLPERVMSDEEPFEEMSGQEEFGEFTCCGTKLSSIFSLKNHLNEMHCDKCPVCDFSGMIYEHFRMIDHYLTSHLGLVECHPCEDYVRPDDMNSHVNQMHPNTRGTKRKSSDEPDSPVTKAKTRAQEMIDEPRQLLEEARERAKEEKARLEAEEERKKGKEQAEDDDIKKGEDEEQGAKLDEVEDLISITIMGFDFPHEDMADFRVAPSRKVLTVQEDYAELIGVPVSQLVFIHEGREMGSLEATLSESLIEDGDFIKVKRKLEVGPSMRDDTETEKQAEPQTEQQNDDQIVDPGGSAAELISESVPRAPIKVKFVDDEELSDTQSLMIDFSAPSMDPVLRAPITVVQDVGVYPVNADSRDSCISQEISRIQSLFAKNDNLPRIIHLSPSNLAHEAENPFAITLMQYADFTHLMEFQVSSSTLVRDVQKLYAKRVRIPVSELIFEHSNRMMGALGTTISEDKIKPRDSIKVKSNWLVKLNMKKELKTEQHTFTGENQISKTVDKKTTANKRPKIKEEIMTITLVDHREPVNSTSFMNKYRVKASTKFEKVVMSYAKSAEVSNTSRLSFLHEGKRIVNSDGGTILDCKITDGDTIEVHEV